MKIKKLILLFFVLVLLSSLAIAQPLGLKTNTPEEAIRTVEKYMAGLGKSSIEHVERLGNNTFLFVIRVKNEEELGGDDTIHYITITRYKGYKIISDDLAVAL